MEMALGEFRFDADTASFGERTTNHKWRWHGVVGLGDKPVYQYLGEGETTMRLSGTLYPHHTGGLGQMPRLVGIASEGTPQTLTAGDGSTMGSWVITDVNRTESYFNEQGHPKRILFDITLKQVF